MSWVRALHIAQNYFQTGLYKKIMILNAEFNASAQFNDLDTSLFRMTHPEALKWTFPTFTIGEATSVTLLSVADVPFKFKFLSKPEFADLCTIPCSEYKAFTTIQQ